MHSVANPYRGRSKDYAVVRCSVEPLQQVVDPLCGNMRANCPQLLVRGVFDPRAKSLFKGGGVSCFFNSISKVKGYGALGAQGFSVPSAPHLLLEMLIARESEEKTKGNLRPSLLSVSVAHRRAEGVTIHPGDSS